jgi:hypothetical protein
MAEFDAQKDVSGDENVQDTPVTLSDDHINTVFSAYLEFMRYLKNIYGKDADRVAKDMGIRAREAASARIEDDDDTSDSDDEDEKPKKVVQPAQSSPTLSAPPAITSIDGLPATTETNTIPNLPPSLSMNGSPTPSSAAGSYQLSSQAPTNLYMTPNGYPGGPQPNYFPPYMMYNPQQFMQGQGQYPNIPPQQAQASLAPGSPPQMPNVGSQMPNMMPQMPNMTPQMATQGWPSMNWQGMQGGPMMYPGMGRVNEGAPPVSQPQS